MKSTNEKLYVTILFLLICCAKVGNTGKTAAKAGLTGITQVRSSSTSYNAGSDDIDDEVSHSAQQANRSALRYLKFNLFQKEGYDKAVRPVIGKDDSVAVVLDLTFHQVLNLNEKEQTITSLLYYRLYWNDAFLTWNPDDYDGIENIWLPSHSIWMPDIVCYEETGSRDFNPRIPFVVVHYDGTVRYLEPTALQTTCQIKISYFPFDVQICNLTFASWTFPTKALDLSSRRSEAELRADIETFSANSGEWALIYSDVKKKSTSYLHLAADLSEGKNYTKEERDVMMMQSFVLDPQSTVAEVEPLRTTTYHWSEVMFSYKFKRNSVSYIQSMLFPAFLLTAISILGFYLPPESGERIGLQITILLTFMVFILTVGDMFPASTGPYLGVYFVLCMALLGLNIIMTVLVLHLHHIPCKIILMVDPIKGERRSNLKILPFWIRLGMILTGVYNDLKTFAIPSDSQKGVHEKKTMLGNILNKWRSTTQSRVGNKRRAFVTTISNDKTEFVQQVLNSKLHKFQELPGHQNDVSLKNSKSSFTKESNQEFLTVKKSQPKINETSKIGSKNWKENISVLNKIMKELLEVSKNLSLITTYSNTVNSAAKLKNAEIAMEEKWKSVARKVDARCMVVYITLMVLFHVVIVLVVIFGG